MIFIFITCKGRAIQHYSMCVFFFYYYYKYLALLWITYMSTTHMKYFSQFWVAHYSTLKSLITTGIIAFGLIQEKSSEAREGSYWVFHDLCSGSKCVGFPMICAAANSFHSCVMDCLYARARWFTACNLIGIISYFLYGSFVCQQMPTV